MLKILRFSINAALTVFALTATLVYGQSGLPSKDYFEKGLSKLIVTNEDSGTGYCISVAPDYVVDAGFADIRFERAPGAHRIVLADTVGLGWGLVHSYPLMLLLSRAGFYRRTHLDIDGPGGVPVPAIAFELTRQGYEALRGEQCFLFGKPKSVTVLSYQPIEAGRNSRL